MHSGGLALVGLERDLQHSIAQGVAIQALDGHQRLFVVGHGDEAKALALVRLQITNHFDTLNSTERTEQLPE